MTSPVSLPLFCIILSNVGTTVTHEISLLSLNSRWSSFYREESRSRAARLEPCTRCVGREKEACRSGKHAARNKRLDGGRVASRRVASLWTSWVKVIIRGSGSLTFHQATGWSQVSVYEDTCLVLVTGIRKKLENSCTMSNDSVDREVT